MKRILPIFVFALFLSGCGMCGNNTVLSVTSPNGGYVAVVYTRDCGATTGFSTQVSILTAPGRLKNRPGNILRLDREVNVSVKWNSDMKLAIKGSLDAEDFLRETSFKGIQIQYD